jgi:hypothetical protein
LANGRKSTLRAGLGNRSLLKNQNEKLKRDGRRLLGGKERGGNAAHRRKMTINVVRIVQDFKYSLLKKISLCKF